MLVLWNYWPFVLYLNLTEMINYVVDEIVSSKYVHANRDMYFHNVLLLVKSDLVNILKYFANDEYNLWQF